MNTGSIAPSSARYLPAKMRGVAREPRTERSALVAQKGGQAAPVVEAGRPIVELVDLLREPL
jgi:hypothetical protein